MAHFAQLDENNTVTWITHLDDSLITDENGVEQESLGIQHIHNTIPGSENYTWKQTSLSGSFRFRYALLGGYYDEALDAFIPRKEHDNWIFDSNKLEWIPPVPKPDQTVDGDDIVRHYWDQEAGSWIEFRETKRFASWSASFDDEGYLSWNPPKPFPTDGSYKWDEELQDWVEVEN